MISYTLRFGVSNSSARISLLMPSLPHSFRTLTDSLARSTSFNYAPHLKSGSLLIRARSTIFVCSRIYGFVICPLYGFIVVYQRYYVHTTFMQDLRNLVNSSEYLSKNERLHYSMQSPKFWRHVSAPILYD